MSTIFPDWQKKIEDIANHLKLAIRHESDGNLPGTGPAPKNYRVLFSGSPEIAKNFADRLGTASNQEVHKVDLSTIVTNYIGETEKNLDHHFAEAMPTDSVILLFDEADSLFGKRSDVQDSHDRYANQEVSFLLQRIGQHDGLIILATHQKDILPPHFLSRFHTILHFPNG